MMRPAEINEIKVTYINTTKSDNFNNNICYFAVSDSKPTERPSSILYMVPVQAHEFTPCTINVPRLPLGNTHTWARPHVGNTAPTGTRTWVLP